MTTGMTWLPAWRIAELVADAEVSPVDVVDHFLARIEELEPKLHAFFHVDTEGAREQALAAEKAVREGRRLGPLHGVPYAVTDAHMVKGYANPMWRIAECEYDELFVQRMRDAGAILVGSTATYHWAPLDRPRNPWNLERDSGNSSRGSAVAVAAGMLPVTVGMDGAGSTRLPAAWSGVIGVSPSRGLVPHFDPAHAGFALTTTHGPMAREARDAALVLQVMAGPDGRDFISNQADTPDYLARIEDGLDGLRVAWTDDYGWSRAEWVQESAAITEFARTATFDLAEHGAEVAETHEAWQDCRPAMHLLSAVNAGMGYTPPIDPHELDQRQAIVDEAWGWTGPTPSLEEALSQQSMPSTDAHVAAIEDRHQAWELFRNVLSQHDVIISTTTPMEPRTLTEWGLNGRHYTMTSYSAHTGMFNFLGFPAVTVPCGFVNDLPVGLQVVSLPGREDVILRVVRAIQQVHPLGRRPDVAQ